MNVCFFCGLPRPDNRRQCPRCHSVPCLAPDGTTIAAAASAIRLGWSVVRLARCELHETLEVTEAHKCGDHMRRKPRQED
jgi:hypothetical protein